MTPGHWQAKPHWTRIDLLSDVHLHPGMRRTFDAWRSHLLDTPADAVLILGDLFEAWVGDDSRNCAFERDCVEVLRQASGRKALAFMHGNRDFLLGEAMCQACGMQSLADPTVAQAWGQRVLLTHGDALCLADSHYQRFRREVRSQAWQRAFLALPLAERRERARAMRDASAQHQATTPPGRWADVDETMAEQWLEQADAQLMVHGHTHRPATHAMAYGRVRHVLGDWHFESTPQRAITLCWTLAGLTPIDLGAV